MRWIFVNEERIWKNRGGRDPTETMEFFLGFLEKEKSVQQDPFPGIIAITTDPELDMSSMNITDHIIAYLIGEFSDEHSYEGTMGYVNKDYSKLNIAVQMYLRISEHLYYQRAVDTIFCDMIKGAVDKIIASSPPLSFARKIGLDKCIIVKQEDSYQLYPEIALEFDGNRGVENEIRIEDTDKTEQFEQIVLKLPLLIAAWNSYLQLLKIKGFFGFKDSGALLVECNEESKALVKKETNWKVYIFIGVASASLTYVAYFHVVPFVKKRMQK